MFQKIRQIISNKIEKIGILVNYPKAFQAKLSGCPIDLYVMLNSLSRMGINFKTILDIGAFEGMFTKSANYVFPDATIHAFEPQKGPYIKLSRLKNKIPNFNCYNFALGDKENEETIYVSSFAPSSSLLKMEELHKEAFPFSTGENKENIRVKRLDDVFNDQKLIGPVLMKIDVQGYEKYVLNGATTIIDKIDYLICEMSLSDLYKEQPTFNEIYTQIITYGFTFAGPLAILRHPNTTEVLQIDGLFIKNK